MKIRYIPYLTIVLAALLLSACHSIMDDEVCADQPSDTTTPVQIGFTLTTGDVSSRAITEGEEAGTGHENYIDIANNNFRILLFKTDNTYLTALKVNRITQTGDDGTTYYVEGELDEAYTDFKLVVLANWGTYTDSWTSETTIADVCEATYSYSNLFKIENDLIPMYGVQTYNNIELRADLLTELPTEIALLRAMAKIEVTCSAEGFKLSGVKLHRYNTKGYCAPTGVNDNTATDWEYDNNTVCQHPTHIPADAKTESDLVFTTKTENGFIAYVPEFDNNSAERNYIEVTLQHEDKSEVTLNSDPYIYFCEYENGEAKDGTDFDIVRNHWYKYDITKVDDGKLIFQYRVMKWNVESSAIGWDAQFEIAAWNSNDYDAPNLTDAAEGDEEAAYCYVVYPRYANNAHTQLETSTHEANKGETVPSYAGFYFKLDAPDGAVWTAHLTNKTNDFRFGRGQYNAGSKKRFCVSTGIAREEPYQIQITANNAWTDVNFNNLDWGNQVEQSGREVFTEFYITVSRDGKEDYELVINPKNVATNTHWKDGRRFAGTDTRIYLWQFKATKGDDFTQIVKNILQANPNHTISKFWDPNSKANNDN